MRAWQSFVLGWLAAGMLTASPILSQTAPQSSGGPLLTEQAAYDVHFYDLALRLDPADSVITGVLTMHARVVQPVEHLVLHLDTLLSVNRVTVHEAEVGAGFERRGVASSPREGAQPGNPGFRPADFSGAAGSGALSGTISAAALRSELKTKN